MNYIIINKRGISLLSIFMILTIISIFAYTLVGIIDRQLLMRDNIKSSTSISFVSESALMEVMNFLRLNPDVLRNYASVYEGASIYSVTSRAHGFIPTDIIGTYYSYLLPGKFVFEEDDSKKSIAVELSEVIKAKVIGVNHEESAGLFLKIHVGVSLEEMNEVYNAQEDDEHDVTGTEIYLEFPEAINIKFIELNYGDIPRRDINNLYVFDNFHYDERELKTEYTDELNKFLYNYKIIGNKIYITSRAVSREKMGDPWNIDISHSMEAKYHIDSGGNLRIIDKKSSDRILKFPEREEFQ
ncbi:MAG: hypothetical protein ACQESP_04070 [Candidatus Muiribacteriota bacterium]